MGSALLAINGIRDVADLDILTTPDRVARLKDLRSPHLKEKQGSGQEPALVYAPPTLDGEIQVTSQLFDDLQDYLFEDDIWESAIDTTYGAICHPAHFLAIKAGLARQKDWEDIALYGKWRLERAKRGEIGTGLPSVPKSVAQMVVKL